MIVDSSPHEYKSVISSEHRAKDSAATVNDIKDAMTDYYRTVSYGKGDDKTEAGGSKNGEFRMLMADGVKFCNHCKKKGHTRDNCWKLKKEKGGKLSGTKFTGTCDHCGKKGHKKDKCFDLPANASKRPGWYKKMMERKEAAMAAVGSDDDADGRVEYLMCARDDDVGINDSVDSVADVVAQVGVEVGGNLSKNETMCMAKDGATFPDSQQLLLHPNVLIGDTAATKHMTSHAVGMINKHKENTKFAMGDKSTALYSGDINGRLCNKFGEAYGIAKLSDVALSKEGYNLFSRTKLQNDGWLLHGDKESIWLTKGNQEIRFDIKISTPKGMLFTAYIQHEVGATAVGTKSVVSMSYDAAHDLLGHMGREVTKATAKGLGWTLKDDVKEPCEHCAVGKAKQKSMPQVIIGDPLKEGESRVHLDISTLKVKPEQQKWPTTSRPNWRIVVDAKSGLAFTDWFTTKNKMIEPTCALFHEWQENGRPVTHLRMDNAGENLKLMERCKSADWKLGVKKFELTARDSPQQNAVAEVKLATMGDRGRAMMDRANIPPEMLMVMYPSATETATKLDGLTLVTINGVTMTRYEHCGLEMPTLASNLRTYGEAGVVKIKSKTDPKAAIKGITCVFVGYPDNHSSDCFKMMKPATQRYVETRDVVWLNRMYYQKDGQVLSVDLHLKRGRVMMMIQFMALQLQRKTPAEQSQ